MGRSEGKAIKIANIVPSAFLDLVNDDSYHLTLAELVVRDTKYAAYYRHHATAGNFVILDNGAYEFGRTPSIDTLVQAAGIINPSEIVLPDSMHGPDCALDTSTMSREGARLLAQAGHTRFMAVPHGNNLSEWERCMLSVGAIPHVATIGIAEKDALKLGVPRFNLISEVHAALPHVDIHLLGMMEDMSDLRSLWIRRTVRGIDGSKLFIWGINGHRVPVSGPLPVYPGRPPDFFDMPRADVPSSKERIARYNMENWKQFVNEPAVVRGEYVTP
jgi:hypothetical protein